MSTGFDAYSLVARILPGYITLTPIIMLFLFLPNGIQISFAGAALMLPVLYFIAYQIGRERGKNKEEKLWTKWGGPPTTQLLRHSNLKLQKHTKELIHIKLRKFELHVPSAEEEATDATLADEYYETCTYLLRAKTRQIDKFPLVFRSLVNYGFQRNLLGLKPVGILMIFISLAACGVTAYLRCLSTGAIISLSMIGAINVGLLAIWVMKVTEGAVQKAAEEYARFILEATLTLEDA